RYEYYLTVTLEALYCQRLDGTYKIQVNESGEREIVILDEAGGALKPGSEWHGGLHNALRLINNIPYKEEHLTSMSMPITQLLPRHGRECQFKTKDGDPLITTWSGATGTEASKEIYRIYGKKSVHIASPEAEANGAMDAIASGKSAIFHCLTEKEAEKKRRELVSCRPEISSKIQILSGAGESRVNTAINTPGQVVIIYTDNNRLIENFRNSIKEIASKGRLALIGRIRFIARVYKTESAKMAAGLETIWKFYKEKLSVIARVRTMTEAEEMKRNLVEKGTGEQDIGIIDAANIRPENLSEAEIISLRDNLEDKDVELFAGRNKDEMQAIKALSPEEFRKILSEEIILQLRVNIVLRQRKIAIVAGNIINRGINTIISDAVNGNWLVGVNLYCDKHTAEEIQFEGRVGRNGSAGEWVNFYSLDELLSMAQKDSETYKMIQRRILKGELEEEITGDKDVLRLFKEIREMNTALSITSAEESMKFDELLYTPIGKLGNKSVWEIYQAVREAVLQGELKGELKNKFDSICEAVNKGNDLLQAMKDAGIALPDTYGVNNILGKLVDGESKINRPELERFLREHALNETDSLWQEFFSQMQALGPQLSSFRCVALPLS
ncbi:MAG: hypothetical protein AAB267_00585, partial [Candidatus Desantisbacteria bacterium]